MEHVTISLNTYNDLKHSERELLSVTDNITKALTREEDVVIFSEKIDCGSVIYEFTTESTINKRLHGDIDLLDDEIAAYVSRVRDYQAEIHALKYENNKLELYKKINSKSRIGGKRKWYNIL